MDIKSRNLKAYLKLRSAANALEDQYKLTEGEVSIAWRKLTGGQLAEASRIIRNGNPYSAIVRVTVHNPNSGGN